MTAQQDRLSILSQTIAAHARKIANEDWRNEHAEALNQIFRNPGISDMLRIDEREIPVESVIRPIRDVFLENRTRSLIEGLSNQIVAEAF